MYDLITTWSIRWSDDIARYYKSYKLISNKKHYLLLYLNKFSNNIKKKNSCNQDNNIYQNNYNKNIFNYKLKIKQKQKTK